MEQGLENGLKIVLRENRTKMKFENVNKIVHLNILILKKI